MTDRSLNQVEPAGIRPRGSLEGWEASLLLRRWGLKLRKHEHLRDAEERMISKLIHEENEAPGVRRSTALIRHSDSVR